MSESINRIVMYDRRMQVEESDTPATVGDTYEVIRGNGPREGERMGLATVIRFDDDGSPILRYRAITLWIAPDGRRLYDPPRRRPC